MKNDIVWRPRPKLPDNYKKVYSEWMAINRTGGTQVVSLANRLERWMHYQVAKDLKNFNSKNVLTTLEIGAGTINHKNYERDCGPYDIIEPDKNLLSLATNKNRVRHIYDSIYDIEGSEKYDRIISIAVLEHLTDLPSVLHKASQLLKPGGTFRAGIPNEGSWLWKLGWSLTTARVFQQKYGLDYGVLMAYEHVSTAEEIIAECRKVFKKVTVRSFGLTGRLSLYRFIEAK